MLVCICYSRTIFTSALLLISILADGQVLITADTISLNCTEIYRTRTDKFVITSQDEYERSAFFTGYGDGCSPFSDIDFEKSILTGFKYRGSNCDTIIDWSAIVERGNEYLVQFSTSPKHVCRDLQSRIAWFIIDKPQRKVDIAFERVFRKTD
jgi:hypothetical protein